jgi:CDP-glucose 4,6-dehydratase
LIDRAFWRGRRVFLTGNTGFKGAWMSIWLEELGAEVSGYALDPPTEPSLYALAGLDARIATTRGDVRDFASLEKSLAAARPEIAIHLAAQSLVGRSYEEPLLSYGTNVMGTANLLEAARGCESLRSVVIVTSDKCYDNKGRSSGYREEEALGGEDPYSSSKACAEMVAAAYRSSFFGSGSHGRTRGAAIATARAGNAIGGGDWAADRLVPDLARAAREGRKALIRNPDSIRPWQFVLEPIAGYLRLAERLYAQGAEYAEAWNFGPDEPGAKSVRWIAERLCAAWPGAAGLELDESPQPREAACLKLDSSKAKSRLGWRPTWDLETALRKIVDWDRAYARGEDAYSVTARQVREFEADCGGER